MGRTDPITGETWGQVTRNGAKAQYAAGMMAKSVLILVGDTITTKEKC